MKLGRKLRNTEKRKKENEKREKWMNTRKRKKKGQGQQEG